ncbi:predicted protein [Enterococcus gallinarum EG2]|nr:predicted protein [Enterococcus gallinarum EG2]
MMSKSFLLVKSVWRNILSSIFFKKPNKDPSDQERLLLRCSHSLSDGFLSCYLVNEHLPDQA